MQSLTGTGNQSSTSIGFSVPAKGNFIVGLEFRVTSPLPSGERLTCTPQIPGESSKAQTLVGPAPDPASGVTPCFLSPGDDIHLSVSASAGASSVSWEADVYITQGNDVA